MAGMDIIDPSTSSHTSTTMCRDSSVDKQEVWTLRADVWGCMSGALPPSLPYLEAGAESQGTDVRNLGVS